MIRNFLQERDFEHGYAKAMYENRETFLEVGEDINFMLTEKGKIILEK